MNIEEIVTKGDLAGLEERIMERIDLLKKHNSESGIQKEWITTAEFQKYFGIKSANTIQNLIHRHRELKPAKLGGKNLFHLPTINKFLKKNYE